MIEFIAGILAGTVLAYALFRYSINGGSRRQAAIPADENEKRLLGLVENTKDGIYYLELQPKWRYRYAYPPFEQTYGDEQGKLVYDHPKMALERVHPDDRDALLKKLRGEVDYNLPIIYRVAMGNEAARNGEYTLFEEYTTPVYQDGELVAIQGILRDITEKHELQKQLEYRISHDTLTGLYNRDYFEKWKDTYDKNEVTAVALVIIDLDNLKIVNDTHGHRTGDTLLKAAAAFMEAYSSEKVQAARIGGDEFAFMITDTGREELEEWLQDLVRDLSDYNEGRDIPLRLSVGFALSEVSVGRMEALYAEADRRMYEDKNRRKGGGASCEFQG
ncbi:GGDEF domain-containing protein [Paenibacillus sp. HN-1]|uniref:GGDEF domain-containing protein n=1 Tax=Paenibacillus TaxID=44249 RepID=UPI001CA9292A|nr:MULTISPECIES: sensor domain-containing diguanylate cyclase [Paenibacillus]MBY9079170.1 GGDEF domain-containing protein [Paenibacillus sp. CGMCC 1.18879]MBY9087333.1 GGDEF domain-containing protein [Paenibacillus sinensis]